jgi:hypothetical protein
MVSFVQVRGNPIPVVRDLGKEEEEKLLISQLELLQGPAQRITSFQSATNAEGKCSSASWSCSRARPTVS